MNKSLLFKSHLFKKYFLSYLGVFICAFLLFGIYIYNTTISELRDDVEEANRGQLSQVEQVITDNLRNIRTLADRMGMDSELIPYKVRNNYYTNSTTNQIRLYKESHAWIDEIFVYYGDYLVQSSSGTLSTSTLSSFSPFFEDIFGQNEAEESKPVIENINVIDYQTNQSNKTNNKLIYTLPIKMGAMGAHATAYFVIDKQEVVKVLDGINDSATIILNTNNTPVVHSSAFSETGVSDIVPLIGEGERETQIRHNETDFRISTVSNNPFDWNYVNLTRTNLFYEKLNNTYHSLFIFLFLSVVLGAILSLLISIHQYSPFKRMLHYLHNLEDHTELSKGNEIEKLNDLIADVISENKTLNNVQATNRPLIRNQLFVQLLEGNIGYYQMNNLLASNDLELFGEKYFVATIKLGDLDADLVDKKALQSMMEMFSDYRFKKYIINGILLEYKNELVFTIGVLKALEAETEQELQKNVLDLIEKELPNVIDGDYCFGVGTSYDSLEKIKQSYIESVTALEYAFKFPKSNLLYFENIHTVKKDNFSYDYKKELLLFEKSLKEGEKEVAKDAVGLLKRYLSETQLTMTETKFITFEIVQAVANSVIESSIPETNQTIEKLMSVQSIEQLLPLIDLCIIKITSAKEEAKLSDQDNIVNEIMYHIDQNYLSSSLSLEEIASLFDFSVSYVSRLIKENKDTSFSHYLQNLRMNEFKRRLVNTNLPIKQLVFEVGYIDVSNFTRKFKKQMGVTPSEYRKMNKKELLPL